MEKRAEARKYLRWGDITKLAKTAGVARNTVDSWLRGEIKNSMIEVYVDELIAKRKKEVAERVNGVFKG